MVGKDMTDPFTDVADELMSRSTDAPPTDSGANDAASTDMASDFPAAPSPTAGTKTKKHVCPYCGAVTNVVDKPTGPCPRCSMDDTPATRAATKSRIGPWYVLQSRNPSAPGMKWATLLSLVSKGQVTPRSVVRGPTTHQLWKFAAHVKGLSREFNLCYSCGGEIEKNTNQCIHCDRLQEPPVNPDTLLETRDIAAASGPRAPIQREIRSAPMPMPMAGQAPSMPAIDQPTDLVIAGPIPPSAPAAAQDDTRRPFNPDDGILSAKELAAAFQLDFNPQIETPMPAAQQESHNPPRVLKTLVVLFFLAVIGAGAVVYIKPEYHDKATAWINQQLKSSKHYLASATDKKSADANSTANKTALPFGASAAAPTTPSGEQSKPADSSAVTPSGASNTAAPADASANTAAPTNPQPSPAPVVISAPNPPTPTPTPAADHSQPDQSANTAAPQNAAPTAPPPAAAQQTATPPAPAAPSPAAQQTAEQQRQEQLQKIIRCLEHAESRLASNRSAGRAQQDTLSWRHHG